jgi:hypothetical protein
VVLTGGASLTGLDSLFRGLAQQAFGTMLVCILAGGAGGFAFAKHQSGKTVSVPTEAARTSDVSSTVSAGFCINCGTALPQKAEFCPACGSKKF